MRIIPTILLLLCFSMYVTAQNKEGSCTTSTVMNDHFKKHPKEYQEFLKFNEYSKNFGKQRSKTQARLASSTIIIPVVFHIYGRTQNGSTITDENIINSLKMVNEDFQGLNPDFDTVDPLFVGRKSKTNILFKLAAIDPNGNPTTGIVDHAASGGQGNYNSPIVAADAWDNYKYMNVYITEKIHDDGKDSTRSGIAWYPSKKDSDANLARVVYNGRYLKGNTDDEFASILTHEFGHWLNLLHTFEGGCASLTQDYVSDTPQEDKASSDDGCIVGATDCGDSLINYENYMGYDSAGGCAKMFTKGQTDRMYAALNHSARFPLWQNANLIATGTGGSLAVTPRMHDGNTWKENTKFLTVCPGTNVKIGMQNVGLQNVELIKPNGSKDITPDGSTFWNLNNVQANDAGTYLIKYKDNNGGTGFGVVRIQVGFELVSWLKVNDDDWYSGDKLKACPGSNITIAMPSGLSGTKSLRLPNGSIHNVADNDGSWVFNNITNANAGVYTLIYDLGGCSYTTEVEVITQNKLTPWVALNNAWVQRDFVEACVGDKVHLGMQNIGTQNVTITGPNGFFDSTPDVGTGFEFTSITDQHYGTYTITWNDPASCSGSVDLVIRPTNNGLEGYVRDNANKWTKSNTIFACAGDNIAIGTHNKYAGKPLKLTRPDGTSTTTNEHTFWTFNNINGSNAGDYKIEYDNGRCYGETIVTVKVGVEDLSNKIQYQLNEAQYTNATNNTLTINEGDKIRLKIPQNLFNGSIAWTGPNNFSSDISTIEITDSADASIHGGTYTATITSTNGCNSANATQTVNFIINFGGGNDDTQAPSAPSNLTATNITTSSLTLSWGASTDNVGVTSYEVFRGATSIGTSTTTSFNVSGLTPATSYAFTVKAKDAAGNTSIASNQVNATTEDNADTQAPTAPTNLVASNISTTILSLSWGASTDNVGVASYEVFRGATSIGTSTTTSFQVNGLTSGTSYTFTVKAKDAAGNESAASNEVSVTTTEDSDTQAPTAPSNLTVSNLAETGLDLNWTASTDNVGVTGYDVYQGANKIATVAVTNYSVTGLQPDTNYSFSVKARDAAGNESSASNVVNTKTLGGDIGIPVTYCEASNAQGSLHITRVQFGGIDNSTGYTAYSNHTNISTNLNVGEATPLTVNLNNGHWTFNAVGVWIDWNNNGNFEDAGEKVYSKFAAGPYTANITAPSSASGNSVRMRVRVGYGSEAKITPCGADTYLGEVEDYTITVGGAVVDTQAPSVPSGVVASNITETTLSLNWVASTDNVGVTSYEVYRDGNSIGTTNTTAYNATGLVAGTTYTFTVKANDAAGNSSGLSSAINVTTSSPASGNVVYVDMNDVTINSGTTWSPFQMETGDGDTRFYTWYTSNSLRMLYTNNKPLVTNGTTGNVTYITEGTTVGSSSNFNTESQLTLSSNSYSDWHGKSGYIGFSFKISGATHYGWLYLTVSSDGNSVTFKDYAYNSTAGEGLIAQRPAGTSSKVGKSKEEAKQQVFSELKAYPNPFNNQSTIDLSSLGNEKITLSVYNILGKELMSKEYSRNPGSILIGDELEVSGSYFVKIITKSKTETLKIIKQ
ncbi:conserved protein of unknown function precursor containing a T9SS type A C-terminal secretion signal [Tenacibaculum sp. 190524A02b]|uniref:fibronectin type III domain-containing protein n=1 Tax=Tenacibaculum vairaonense TaxID=3137860 RepID=UPI0032B1C781